MRKIILSFILFLLVSPVYAFSPAIQAVVSTGGTVVCSNTIKESDITDEASRNFSTGVSDIWAGYKWTAANSFTLVQLDVLLSRENTECTNTLTAYIYTNGTGPGSSSGQSTNTVNVSDLAINGIGTTWGQFTFTGVSITATTVYWIVLKSSTSADCDVQWRKQDDASFGANSYYIDDDGSGSWSVQQDNEQGNFKVYACE
jgi:hypothetical protein